MTVKYTPKQRLGSVLFDMPRYLYYLNRKAIKNSHAWLRIRNRNEKFTTSQEPFGVHCQWRWTSDLSLPKMFPYFGQQLYSKAQMAYPFSLAERPQRENGAKEASFIIGHRGSARLDLLLKTIDSIAAQENCNIECIVVEQDNEPVAKNQLPEWVDYVFTPLKDPEMAYSRSWAFNVGAAHANSECLIFHDNDMLIPRCYAREIANLVSRGFDFVNLKRFIFYLSKESSSQFIEDNSFDGVFNIDSIVQNLEGGGSIGASKEAFQQIGGFDQRFIGWGGEDNEFWERALTQKVWSYGYLPLIHLWHQPQTEKLDIEASATKALYNELSLQPPLERIAELKTRFAQLENERV